jgi:hypothetical protein
MIVTVRGRSCDFSATFSQGLQPLFLGNSHPTDNGTDVPQCKAEFLVIRVAFLGPHPGHVGPHSTSHAVSSRYQSCWTTHPSECGNYESRFGNQVLVFLGEDVAAQ